MTQTSTTPTIAAETIFVSTAYAGTPAETFQLKLEGTLGDPDMTVLTLRASAEQLLKDLAAQLGYTVLSTGQRQQLTEDMELTVERARERQNSYLKTLEDGYLLANHASDDVRDLRTELRAAGVIN
ncbi:hypothetical protein [Longimicrobium sp.]|jgi:hypothetical protein|uniref:hypothetical protein n=1 Tax=Longimicrobium sp. TaxID=2029185 RepID=UPI002EDAAA48